LQDIFNIYGSAYMNKLRRFGGGCLVKQKRYEEVEENMAALYWQTADRQWTQSWRDANSMRLQSADTSSVVPETQSSLDTSLLAAQHGNRTDNGK